MGEEYLRRWCTCAECMKMCGLGGKNSVVKGLSQIIKEYVPVVSYHLSKSLPITQSR